MSREATEAADRVAVKRAARSLRRDLLRAGLDALVRGEGVSDGERCVEFRRETLYDAIEAAVEAVEHAHRLPASSGFLVFGESLLAAARTPRPT